MSLNLIIRSDKSYESSGTGVFIRDSRGTRELQTLDEIKEYFPELDINNITPIYYENYEIWNKEITHNLAYMASHIPINNTNLYYYLWRPEEIGFKFVSKKYIEGIEKGFEYMKENKNTLQKYNPHNIGTYSDLLEFVESLYECLRNLRINHSDEFEIIAER